MAAATGFIALIALIIIVVIVWYFVYGINLPGHTISPTTSVTPGGGINTTNTTNGTTTSSIIYSYPCDGFNIFTQGPNSTSQYGCTWGGGALGLWVASGNSTYEQFQLIGANNVTYVNQISTYQCTTFFENFSVPSQSYTVKFATGPSSTNASANCMRPGFVLNTTLSPPPKAIYSDIYNANFSNGEYTGWNTTGKGFGSAPLDIISANDNTTSQCYLGQRWSNFIGTYFASTFNCGTSVTPGNLTSSTFYATKAFLNFRIISPQSSLIYVEILYNGTPAITAHYDTYNISFGANASSTFRNASIPLFTVRNKPVQIRVVANNFNQYGYIAIGDFAQSATPRLDPGISQEYNFSG